MEPKQGKEIKEKNPFIIVCIKQEQDALKKEYLENKIELSIIPSEKRDETFNRRD